MIGWDDRPFKPSDYHFLQGVPTRCVSSPEKLGPPGGIRSVSAHDHVHAVIPPGDMMALPLIDRPLAHARLFLATRLGRVLSMRPLRLLNCSGQR